MARYTIRKQKKFTHEWKIKKENKRWKEYENKETHIFQEKPDEYKKTNKFFIILGIFSLLIYLIYKIY